jgi:hypothetical protein
MAQKKKRRTSIRTAAGTVQEKFIARMAALREAPLAVVPVCPEGDPKSIAKIRLSLARFANGKKPGFFDKRDKGIVGAVAHSIPLADLQTVPRILDMKIAGKRRFFLQRGHVARSCMLGVQNHDEPRALLMAYRDMAKAEGLHFFAGDQLWCSGQKPMPPQAWVDTLATDVDAPAHAIDGGWCFGKDGAGHVRLRFRDGPCIDIDPRATKGHHVHQLLAARYAGPRQRHPVEIRVVLRDGTEVEPDRDATASYRAGVVDERRLADDVMAKWRKDARESDALRFVLGEQDFGDDQDAFLAVLNAEAWELEPLRSVTFGGFVGQAETTADVFQRQSDQLGKALVGLGKDAPAFLAKHAKSTARDTIRLGLQEIAAQERESVLPVIVGGPETQAIDHIARQHQRNGTAGVKAAVVSALEAGKVSPGHLAAFAEAIGDKTLSSRWSDDDKASGHALTAAAGVVLAAQGNEYVDALQTFLRSAGSGESVRKK